MPQLIDHIDAIARQKQRDVVFVRFQECKEAESFGFLHDYEAFQPRIDFIQWCEENDIVAYSCGDMASENCLVSYNGQLYIDVPFDTENKDYMKVRTYLEHEDGSMRSPNVTFWAFSLEEAMKNAHHDEPGFWEKWAETF